MQRTCIGNIMFSFGSNFAKHEHNYNIHTYIEKYLIITNEIYVFKLGDDKIFHL